MRAAPWRLGAAFLAAFVFLPSAAAAQPASTDEAPAFTSGASVMVASAYVWRGFQPTEGAAIQPSTWVKFGNLTISSWMNVIAAGGPGSLNEHDLTVDYTRSVGAWSLSAGYINYFFPTADSGRLSDEFFVGAAWTGPLSPTVRVYTDVHEGSGTYVSAGISHTLTIGAMTMTPAATLGYNHRQWVEGSGLSDLVLGVQMTLPSVSRHLSIAPFVTYSKSLHEEWFPSKAFAGATLTVR
jgi:hypothetical protein